MSNLTFCDDYQFFELFSGEGAVSKVWLLGILYASGFRRYFDREGIHHLRASEGYKTASMDRLSSDTMDFLSSSGFAILACKTSTCSIA